MLELPAKLKKDAIAEALFEIQFDGPYVPEVALGRLLDHPEWQALQSVRLPLADFPAVVRQQTPEMKFQPVMELRAHNLSRVVKVGPNVLSYHALAPYPGWDEALQTEFSMVIDHLIGKLANCSALRLGLRYINLLTLDDHGISKISDLNFTFEVSDKPMDAPQMLSFERLHGPRHVAMVKVASPQFVLGPAQKPFTALIDVDVYTPQNFALATAHEMKSWLGDAHEFEKHEFFGLLRPQTIENLRLR